VAEVRRCVKWLSDGLNGIGPTEMGRRIPQATFCRTVADSSKTRSRCDGDHSGNRRVHVWCELTGRTVRTKRGKDPRCRRVSLRPGFTIPRGRASGLGRKARPPPRRSPTTRGERARRLRFSARLGAALANVERRSANLKLHVHAPVRPAGAPPAVEGRRLRLGPRFALHAAVRSRSCPEPDEIVGLRPVPGETGVIRHRLAILRA
jgi:hypothetical protein